MNEALFLFHVIVILFFSFFALKMGKRALIAFIVIQAFLANFFVLKQIEWFGLTITCTDVFSIGSIFSFNLLQEYFGKKEGKKAIKISFFLLFFTALMSQIHLWYAPSPFDQSQEYYENLLGMIPRLFLASFSVFFFSQFLDMQIFSYCKKIFPKLSFGLRSFVSMTVSQFVDTALFAYLALSGILENIWHVILVGYLIKLLVISFNCFFSGFSKRFIPKEVSNVSL